MSGAANTITGQSEKISPGKRRE